MASYSHDVAYSTLLSDMSIWIISLCKVKSKLYVVYCVMKATQRFITYDYVSVSRRSKERSCRIIYIYI